MSCGAPVEFSLSPGVAPLSLLSVSEVWPAPFLIGSSSTSPFSSGAAVFPSASGLMAGAGALVEGKTDGRGTGLLLSRADCRAGSPTGLSTGLGSSCVEARVSLRMHDNWTWWSTNQLIQSIGSRQCVLLDHVSVFYMITSVCSIRSLFFHKHHSNSPRSPSEVRLQQIFLHLVSSRSLV